jgi:cell wall-associated NlpC family hydrolase
MFRLRFPQMSFLTLTARRNRFATVLCTAVALGVPAAVNAQTVAATPKPFEALSNSAQSLRDSVVAIAKAQVGTRYRTGGTSPKKGFDCSGLIKYIMSALNRDVPRTAKQQAVVGLAVARDTSRLLPGDLVTFGKGKKGSVSHIGIYVGDGKFVHASSVAGRVVESKINRPTSSLVKIWKGARRIFAGDDSVSAEAVVLASKGGY